MAAPPPGYLLPDGDAFTEDLACCLVFYPDKPEYRRALTGSLAYLSTWLAWERDSAKRGQDAARAWKNALDETLECMNMTCLEDLIADVETIRILMENKKDCCDDNVTYFPTEEPTTDITPQIGDPPAFYGETAISDWEDWSEHACYNANAYVDYLKDTAGELKEAVSVSTIFIGLIAAALAILTFSGIGLPIAFGLAAGVVAGLVLSATALTFSDSAADFEAARDVIVCAIVDGGNLAAAVEGALGSDAAWDLFYQFIDYDAATAILYEGGHGTDYLPEETSSACSCIPFEHLIFTFPTDVDGFTPENLGTLWNAGGWVEFNPNSSTGYRSGRWWVWTALATRFSFALPVDFDQLKFRFRFDPGTGSMGYWIFNFRLYGKDDVSYASPDYETTEYAIDEWHEITWNLPAVLESGVSNEAIYIRAYRSQSAAAGQRIWIDDIAIYKRP